MRILIIGGTQFIGFAALKRLHMMGHDLAVFNRGKTDVQLPEGVQHISGDIRHLADFREAFEKFAPEVVLHNILFTEKDANLFVDVFRGIAKRIVMVSSMDVYQAYGRFTGIESGEPIPTPMNEDAPVREVFYPYRAMAKDENDFAYHYDKIPAERIVLASGDMPGTVLRLPMVYGENDYQHRLMPFFKPMDDGRSAIVMEQGYAHWRSTFGYVENVAHAIALACINERAAGRVYNVGEIIPSMLELGEMVKNAVGWKGEFVVIPGDQLPESLQVPYGTQHDLASSDKRIREELGFAPIVETAEAIRRTIEWERANLPEDANFAEMFNYEAQDAFLASR
jgi:nucleoside-diphosphate-sugar epimerase